MHTSGPTTAAASKNTATHTRKQSSTTHPPSKSSEFTIDYEHYGIEEGDKMFGVLPIKQMWGFNPLELLEKVEFPNDRLERRLRRTKSARLRAIRNQAVAHPGYYEDSTADQTSEHSLLTDANSLLKLSAPQLFPPGTSVASSSKNSRPGTEENKEETEEMLSTQLARSAAAVMIQAAWRGLVTRRKYMAVMYYALSRESNDTDESRQLTGSALLAANYDVQDSILRKYYKYCQYHENEGRLPPSFPFYCASWIQATYRMKRLKRAYHTFKKAFHKDAMAIFQEMKRIGETASWHASIHIAARKVQRAWKSYYNIKIYRFYRDLIRFRLCGDPKKLLKFINPQESKYVDSASGLHVRFRLGGESFPPAIFYKIYVHNNLVDLNSFAPRNYTLNAAKIRHPRFRFNRDCPDEIDNDDDVREVHDGWYRRYENNGWRPVSDKIWIEQDKTNATEMSRRGRASVSFHHLKLRRKENMAVKRRMRKLMWLKKLYADGESEEDHFPQQQQQQQDNGNAIQWNQASIKAMEGSKDKGGGGGAAEVDGEGEDNALLEWSQDLDFDSYVAEWSVLATTGKSDDVTTHEFLLHTANDLAALNCAGPELTKRHHVEEDDGHLDPDHPHYYQLHPHNLQRQQQQVSTDKKQGGVGDHMYQTRPPKRGEEEKGEEEEKKPIAMIVVKPNSSESRTRGWSGDLVSFEGVENKRILMK